ncbi:TPA: hypothetical protein SL458_003832 [Pseudomonas aeruginosa]|nr:hypothetical protein [Pseudomonas aeruginosa]
MSQEVDKNLAKAIAEIAVFLEFSGDKVIDQDSAVQTMEQLASTLQEAGIETKQSLCNQFGNIAKSYSGEQAEFVESLADSFGLLDE